MRVGRLGFITTLGCIACGETVGAGSAGISAAEPSDVSASSDGPVVGDGMLQPDVLSPGVPASASGAIPSPFMPEEPVLISEGTENPETSQEPQPVCAANSVSAQFRPVYLAFAFDVSGSMGKLDYPYHDPALKWEPVVAATKAFFVDAESKDIWASLSFFPAADDRCDAQSYRAPDVPMTALPSTIFSDAIDDITPRESDDWRGGTPTQAVVDGTFQFLQPLAQADPHSLHALVLVTDGYPQGCDDNSIQFVSEVVRSFRATIPTYVIGVQNPPGGPESVVNLDEVALAGGTDEAFIIATGDPEQTKEDFKAVIETIRGSSVSCDLTIPAPPEGQVFEPQKVNVTYSTAAESRAFGYDQACQHDDAWSYDDPAAPTSIVLCPKTCDVVKNDAVAQLQIEFGCASRAADQLR